MKPGDLVTYSPLMPEIMYGLVIQIIDLEDGMGGQRFAKIFWPIEKVCTENICNLILVDKEGDDKI